MPYPPMENSQQISGSSIFLRNDIEVVAEPATSDHVTHDKIKTLKTETLLGQVN